MPRVSRINEILPVTGRKDVLGKENDLIIRKRNEVDPKSLQPRFLRRE
jgi:hypothetical protein